MKDSRWNDGVGEVVTGRMMCLAIFREEEGGRMTVWRKCLILPFFFPTLFVDPFLYSQGDFLMRMLLPLYQNLPPPLRKKERQKEN